MLKSLPLFYRPITVTSFSFLDQFSLKHDYPNPGTWAFFLLSLCLTSTLFTAVLSPKFSIQDEVVFLELSFLLFLESYLVSFTSS